MTTVCLAGESYVSRVNSEAQQGPAPQCGTQSKREEHLHQSLWNDGVEYRGENQEVQTDVGVSALQVGEGCVHH